MTIESTQIKPKSRGLLRSTGAFAVMTLLSRILGFVRDMVIAQGFGAGAGVDAFFVAFKIPNFMRGLFAEGAFSQAFVPTLAQMQQTQDPIAVQQFISRIAGTLGVILFGLTVFVVLFSPYVIYIFAPGFDPNGSRFILATGMLRWTFPYLFFISLTALAGAALNTYGRFAAPAFNPVLLNLALIVAAVVGGRYIAPPEYALAIGVFCAGILQLGFLLPFLLRLKLLAKPQFAWSDPSVQRVLKLMVPAIFGVSVAQLNLLVGTIFASFLPTGSVSWLYYADRLMNFPLGVFGVAIATVILPSLSQKHALNDPKAFATTFTWGLRWMLLIALPAAIGLLLLAEPLMLTLFGYGKFSAVDVTQASRALRAFAIGLPAFMLIKILATGFYAQRNIRTPVRIGVICIVTNVILNFILIGPMAHAGLALATSLAAWLNVACLFAVLWQQGRFPRQQGWLRFTGQLVLMNLILLGFMYFWGATQFDWAHWGAYQRFSQMLILVLMSVGLYGLSYYCFIVRNKY